MTDSPLPSGDTFTGPHHALAGDDPRERFLADLFDRLWVRYADRVPYVRTYEQIVRSAGGRFVNDHIAFRTLVGQEPETGIHSVARPFEALGYASAGCYEFPEKRLSAIHYQHPNPAFPKLFVSQLRTWELGDETRRIVEKTLRGGRAAFPAESLAALYRLDDATPFDRLLDALESHLDELPWTPPTAEEVVAVNEESQYAAWVLVHGYAVNHFTALVNSHGVPTLDDIGKTVAALAAEGIPMKDAIEGDPGSKLRQSSTRAADIDVAVRDADGNSTHLTWPYAYFELAERGTIDDPATGQSVRFEGFLGEQATHLFEMTRRVGS